MSTIPLAVDQNPLGPKSGACHSTGADYIQKMRILVVPSCVSMCVYVCVCVYACVHSSFFF